LAKLSQARSGLPEMSAREDDETSVELGRFKLGSFQYIDTKVSGNRQNLSLLICRNRLPES
jgi:hypothetical protein